MVNMVIKTINVIEPDVN